MSGCLDAPTMSDRYEFAITEADARQRLDAFLALRFGGISRMRLRQAVDQGDVTVDGAPVVPGHRLRAGEVVVVELGVLQPTAMTPEAIPIEILYEDETLAVVNKPAGMLSHPVRHHKSGTLANALAYHFNEGGGRQKAEAGRQKAEGRRRKAATTDTAVVLPSAFCLLPSGLAVIRPGLAHRLDRATSGLMVVAKTDAALSRLTIDFQNRQVAKRYRALVLGSVAPDRGWVAAPIGRDPDARPRWWVRPDGRRAETRYRVEHRWPDFTLLELDPLTGRTNQLRIHCAWIGHPIAGDTEFGPVAAPEPGGETEECQARRPGVSLPERLFLHASFLAFRHPATNQRMAFASELPVELARCLRELDG
jgi:23S rRNA pseudouridine1911/1915/1917 synthase